MSTLLWESPSPLDSRTRHGVPFAQAAQGVLDARAVHPEDLYDPIAMPPDLRRAHQALDKAVDAAYGKKKLCVDVERVAFLFELYSQYIGKLPDGDESIKKKKPRKTK